MGSLSMDPAMLAALDGAQQTLGDPLVDLNMDVGDMFDDFFPGLDEMLDDLDSRPFELELLDSASVQTGPVASASTETQVTTQDIKNSPFSIKVLDLSTSTAPGQQQQQPMSELHHVPGVFVFGAQPVMPSCTASASSPSHVSSVDASCIASNAETSTQQPRHHQQNQNSPQLSAASWGTPQRSATPEQQQYPPHLQHQHHSPMQQQQQVLPVPQHLLEQQRAQQLEYQRQQQAVLNPFFLLPGAPALPPWQPPSAAPIFQAAAAPRSGAAAPVVQAGPASSPLTNSSERYLSQGTGSALESNEEEEREEGAAAGMSQGVPSGRAGRSRRASSSTKSRRHEQEGAGGKQPLSVRATRREVARLERELQEKLSLLRELAHTNEELKQKERILKISVSNGEQNLLLLDEKGLNHRVASLVQSFRGQVEASIKGCCQNDAVLAARLARIKDPTFALKDFLAIWKEVVRELREKTMGSLCGPAAGGGSSSSHLTTGDAGTASMLLHNSPGHDSRDQAGESSGDRAGGAGGGGNGHGQFGGGGSAGQGQTGRGGASSWSWLADYNTESITSFVMAVCANKPLVVVRVISLNLLTGELEEAPPEHWQYVVRMLELSPTQVSDLIAAFELFQRCLEKIKQERWALAADLSVSLPMDMSCTKVCTSQTTLVNDELLGAEARLKRLQQNFRRGNVMYSMVSFLSLKLLTPEQHVKLTLFAWPFFPNLVHLLYAVSCLYARPNLSPAPAAGL